MEELEDRNWNALWEASFQEIMIDQFCQIRAPFHPVRLDVDHSITIDPRMAFGTGHHETTRLVIRKMKVLTIKGKSVLDFGAGTGILAILAHKMGADQVIALESDTTAFSILEENILANDASAIRCSLKDSLVSQGIHQFDIVLANITRNVLLDHLAQIFRVLKLGGIGILSGFLASDRVLMKDAIEQLNGEIQLAEEENDWMALTFLKK
jgi:ribosomal protein L11 methyltransferase